MIKERNYGFWQNCTNYIYIYEMCIDFSELIMYNNSADSI